MTALKDFMADSFLDDFALNMIKIFEDSKKYKFNPMEIAEVRKFVHSLFDEFTFSKKEMKLLIDQDPVQHFKNLTERFMDKIIGMLNFLIMYKMEEMRLHSRIEELENKLK